jgi:hypothetical protein
MGQDEPEQVVIRPLNVRGDASRPDTPVKAPVVQPEPQAEGAPVWRHVGHVLTG